MWGFCPLTPDPSPQLGARGAMDVFWPRIFWAGDVFATDEHGFSRMKRRVWVGVWAHAKPRSREGRGRVVQGVWFVEVVFDFLPLRNC